MFLEDRIEMSFLKKDLVKFYSNFNIDDIEIISLIEKKSDYLKNNVILNSSNNPYITALYAKVERLSSKKIFFLSQIHRAFRLNN